MLYLFVVLGGAALGAAAVALRRSALSRLRVPPRAALAGAGLGLAVGCVVLFGPVLWPVRRGEPSAGPRPDGPPGLAAKALAPGAAAPPLEAAGWLNGPPPHPGGGPRLIVLDIWAHW